MFKVNKQSILYRYIASYASIVLFSALIIGVTLINLSVKEILDIRKDIINTQLMLAATDLDTQYDIMKSITYEIRVKKYYKPEYYRKNPYYETELLEDFSRFGSWLPFHHEYFLVYQQDPAIFSGNGYKYQQDYFLVSGSPLYNWSEIHHEIISSKSNKIIPVRNSIENFLLFIFQIEVVVIGDMQERATLVFAISEASIKERVENVSGINQGHLSINHEENLIHNLNISHGIDLDNSAFRYFLFEAVVDDFHLQLSYPDPIRDKGMVVFAQTNLIFAFILMLVLLSLGSYLAYRNYKPIQRLVRTVASNVGHVNEFSLLEEQMKQLLSRDITNIKVLDHHKKLLIRHIVSLIITEGYSPSYSKRLNELGCIMPFKYFTIVAIYFENDDDITESLYENIEDEQDEVLIKLLGRRTLDGMYPLLLNVKQPSETIVHAAILSLRLSLKKINCLFYIGVSLTYTVQDGSGASYLQAISALQISRDTKKEVTFFSQINEIDLVSYTNKDLVSRLNHAIVDGNTNKAVTTLETIVDQIENNSVSIIGKRLAYSDILIHLIQTAKNCHINIQQDLIVKVLSAQTSKYFSHAAKKLVEDMIINIEKSRNVSRAEHIGEIMRYINDHFTDYDIGLGRLSDLFNIDESTLSRIVKREAGQPFRSLIINLRINKAIDLICATDLSIQSISEQVGYNSVSHFIKTFSRVTGKKPSDYR